MAPQSQTTAFRELAQLVERHPYKVDVVGSSPAFPTKFSIYIAILRYSVLGLSRVHSYAPVAARTSCLVLLVS